MLNSQQASYQLERCLAPGWVLAGDPAASLGLVSWWPCSPSQMGRLVAWLLWAYMTDHLVLCVVPHWFLLHAATFIESGGTLRPRVKCAPPVFKEKVTGTQPRAFIYAGSVASAVLQGQRWVLVTQPTKQYLPRGPLLKNFINSSLPPVGYSILL